MLNSSRIDRLMPNEDKIKQMYSDISLEYYNRKNNNCLHTNYIQNTIKESDAFYSTIGTIGYSYQNNYNSSYINNNCLLFNKVLKSEIICNKNICYNKNNCYENSNNFNCYLNLKERLYDDIHNTLDSSISNNKCCNLSYNSKEIIKKYQYCKNQYNNYYNISPKKTFVLNNVNTNNINSNTNYNNILSSNNSFGDNNNNNNDLYNQNLISNCILDWSKLGFLAISINTTIFIYYYKENDYSINYNNIKNDIDDKNGIYNKMIKVIDINNSKEVKYSSNTSSSLSIKDIKFDYNGNKLIIITNKEDTLLILDLISGKIISKFYTNEYNYNALLKYTNSNSKIKAINIVNNSSWIITSLISYINNNNENYIVNYDLRTNTCTKTKIIDNTYNSKQITNINNDFVKESNFIEWSKNDTYLAVLRNKKLSVYTSKFLNNSQNELNKSLSEDIPLYQENDINSISWLSNNLGQNLLLTSKDINNRECITRAYNINLMKETKVFKANKILNNNVNNKKNKKNINNINLNKIHKNFSYVKTLNNSSEFFTVEKLKNNVYYDNSFICNKNLTTKASYKITLWDYNHGNIKYIFKGHANEINNIALSPNKEYFASICSNNIIKIWNLKEIKNKALINGENESLKNYSICINENSLIR